MPARRSGRVSEGGMVYAALDQLPRLRRPPATAARTGVRGARDAQHPRGVRAQARREPRRAGPAGPRVLAPHDRGQEARVLGPAPVQRRSRSSRTCRSTGCSPRSTRRRCATRSTWTRPGRPTCSATTTGSTVYFAVADRWGNMVSFVNSIFSGFGSKVTVPGYGFVLANRGERLHARGRPSQRGRSAQAALHHHHRELHHQGRQAGDGVREHGRRHAAAGPRAARGQHGRSRHERPGDHRRGDGSITARRTTRRRWTRTFRSRRPAAAGMGHTIDRPAATPAAIRASCSSAIRACRRRGAAQRQALLSGALEPERRRRRYEQPLNGVYRAGSDPRKDGHAGGW